jgi:hypothetical protein
MINEVWPLYIFFLSMTRYDCSFNLGAITQIGALYIHKQSDHIHKSRSPMIILFLVGPISLLWMINERWFAARVDGKVFGIVQSFCAAHYTC